MKAAIHFRRIGAGLELKKCWPEGPLATEGRSAYSEQGKRASVTGGHLGRIKGRTNPTVHP